MELFDVVLICQYVVRMSVVELALIAHLPLNCWTVESGVLLVSHHLHSEGISAVVFFANGPSLVLLGESTPIVVKAFFK